MLTGHAPSDLRATVSATTLLVSLSLVGCAFITWNLVVLSTGIAIEAIRLNLIKQALERDEIGSIAVVGAIVSTFRTNAFIQNDSTLI